MTAGPKTFKMHIWCICVTLWHFRSFKCPPRVLCSPQTVFTFLFCPFNINIPTQLIVSSACFMMPSLSWMCHPSFVDSLVHLVSILNYLWLSFTKAGITTGQVSDQTRGWISLQNFFLCTVSVPDMAICSQRCHERFSRGLNRNRVKCTSFFYTDMASKLS